MAKEEAQPEQITLVDDDGKEHLYDILFTFSSDDYHRSYIFIYPDEDSGDEEIDIEAYALPKDDDPTNPSGGELEPIEDDKEWEMVEETLNTFINNENQE